MTLTEEETRGLGVALNEATLLGLEVFEQNRVAAATFSVLTLPEEGSVPPDTRVQFLFRRVGRVAASLRLGRWDDGSAEVLPFSLNELLRVVQEFGGTDIYGWEFFDIHEQIFSRWADRLSLDCQWGPEGLSHSISLFQERPDKFLDVCLWFDHFTIRDSQRNEIPMADFIAGGKRWWNGLHSGDERTKGASIMPLKKPL